MLTELHIQNFAIIDHLDLELNPGLVIFTGETGAGKSIIMDALDILMGGRADATAIRTEADLARIEGTFKLSGPERPAAHEILKREELLDDPNFVTLMREVRREGRSVARVNGRTVNVSLLKELGELLIDIHGQSEHLSLLNVHAHLGLLDRYADVEPLLVAYHKAHQELLGIRGELAELREAQRDAERRTEMLTFQAEEIEAAKLKAGEDEGLRKERERLANAESLANLAQEALTVLDEGTPDSPAATDLVGQAAQSLAKLGQIDTSIPFIKSNVMHALTREYAREVEALEQIATHLAKAYPNDARIRPVIQVAQDIYRENFFPEMQANWQVYPDHIGHLLWPGCFRCHDGKHVSTTGREMIKAGDCNACHVILSQGKGDELNQLDARGEEFRHPGEAYDPELLCSDCHSGGM